MEIEAILRILNELIPDKYPRGNISDYDLGYGAGQVALLEKITDMLNETKDN